jgi:hypothetical protein
LYDFFGQAILADHGDTHHSLLSNPHRIKELIWQFIEAPTGGQVAMRRFWTVFDEYYKWLRIYWSTLALGLCYRLFEAKGDPWPYLLNSADTDSSLTIASLWKQEMKSLCGVCLRLLLTPGIKCRMNSIYYTHRGFRTMSAQFYINCKTVSGSVNHYMFLNTGFSSLLREAIRDSLYDHDAFRCAGLSTATAPFSHPFNHYERTLAASVVPSNSFFLGHFALLLSALRWYCHYRMMPASFPWQIVCILSDNEAVRTHVMARLKSFWELVCLLETTPCAARTWILKACPLFKWQIVRELCEIAADSNFIVTTRLLDFVKGLFQVGSSLSLELAFNDARDLERRGRKNVSATSTELQVNQMRSVRQRYPEVPQVKLEEHHLCETGYMEGSHVDERFYHSSKKPDARAGIDFTPLNSPVSPWKGMTPERFSNIQLALITALLTLGGPANADLIWKAGLFCAGMMVEKVASPGVVYMVIFATPYLFQMWPMRLVDGYYILDVSSRVGSRLSLCTSLDEFRVHEYLISPVARNLITAGSSLICFTSQRTVSLMEFVLNHTICNLSNMVLEELSGADALDVTGMPVRCSLADRVGLIMGHCSCSAELIDRMVSLVILRSKKKAKKTEDDEDDDPGASSEEECDPTVAAALSPKDLCEVTAKDRFGPASDGSDVEDDKVPTTAPRTKVFETPNIAEKIPPGCRWSLDRGGVNQGSVPPYWKVILPAGATWHGDARRETNSRSESFDDGTCLTTLAGKSQTMATILCNRWAWAWFKERGAAWAALETQVIAVASATAASSRGRGRGRKRPAGG